MGISNRDRIDTELYDGVESAKDRKKREVLADGTTNLSSSLPRSLDCRARV
jgi:hypothetical protein